MTFLQPFILWALPLVLLPVVIHLLNRMRHRPQPWAAMRFLTAATRSSVNNARLRQWLILALRVLAVLTLILFLSRPLAGGWLGWALSPAPDVIMILVDRSASMEQLTTEAGSSKRQQALAALAKAAAPFEERSHLVLIDSANRAPQELRRAAGLRNLPATGPTDTAADIPGLLSIALNWLLDNRAGTAEIWLASDLQRSNWSPDDHRWQSLASQIQAQKVRVRLLAFNQSSAFNHAVKVKEVNRRTRGDQAELQLAVDLQSSRPNKVRLPLGVTVDGTRRQEEIPMEGQALRWRHNIRLTSASSAGWGSFDLPADANRQDNQTYFTYAPEPPPRALVVGESTRANRLVQLALLASVKNGTSAVEVLPSADLRRTVWEDRNLLVWTEPLPGGALSQQLRGFVEQGGTALFLPPGTTDTARFEGVGWGEVQEARQDRPFRVLRWNEDEGPLAKADDGLSLPLMDVAFQRRQLLAGPRSVLAAYDDGIPFLARQTLGRGEAYFCTSLAGREWSTLGEGPVLVPMMQRLLQSGGRRWQQSSRVACGELAAVDRSLRWESVDAPGKDIQTQAGVYRSGTRLLAVNRPPAEDDPEVLEGADATRLFGGAGVQMLEERQRRSDRLEGEVWRVFVAAMLVFLLVEGVLILPARSPASRAGAASGSVPGRVVEAGT